MPKKLISITAVLLFFNSLQAQEKSWKDQFEFSGYLSGMHSVLISEALQENLANMLLGAVPDSSPLPFDELPWIKDNQLHNRLNTHWYGNNGLRASLQLRTRLNWGDQVLYGLAARPGTKVDAWNWDNRALHLSYSDGINYLFQTEIDRLWLEYAYEKFEMRLGRQRVSWAQTFAFNPNDIFNTYAYFDIDYPEKPGSDALRTTYYLGMASKIEGAVKLNRQDEVTAGLLLKVNNWGYDFQFLGGVLDEEDYVTGLGWAGFINNAGFRGEVSYFSPINAGEDILVSSVGLDYTFTNSLFLQAEYLYNELPAQQQTTDIFAIYQEELSAKRLSITEHSLLVQASYPVSPVFNTSLGLLTYPEESGFYIGPSLDFSLTDNLQFSLIGQVFTLKAEEERLNTYLGFLRVKGSF